MSYRAWIFDHFALFRFGLFLCSFGYWLVGYHWFKPRRAELMAGIMAAWTQFSAGTLLDILIVRRHLWVYRPMELTLYGVPLDLHINWSLIWGFFLVWLYSKLRKYSCGPRFVLAYLTVWTLITVAFDTAVASQTLFLSHASKNWWLADIGFLFTVLSLTLWVYHTILFPPQNPFWAVWFARIRSSLHVGSIAYLFYAYAPSILLVQREGWGAQPVFGPALHPLLGLDRPGVLAAALLFPVLLGTWATWEFTGKGFGTPIPLDPPRRLVLTGPYAYVRNPQQLSGILLACLLVLYYPTRYMLIYVVDMVLVSLFLFSYFEGGELESRFGATYSEYKRNVRNWIPRLRPYRV